MQMRGSSRGERDGGTFLALEERPKGCWASHTMHSSTYLQVAGNRGLDDPLEEIVTLE